MEPGGGAGGAGGLINDLQAALARRGGVGGPRPPQPPPALRPAPQFPREDRVTPAQGYFWAPGIPVLGDDRAAVASATSSGSGVLQAAVARRRQTKLSALRGAAEQLDPLAAVLRELHWRTTARVSLSRADSLLDAIKRAEAGLGIDADEDADAWAEALSWPASLHERLNLGCHVAHGAVVAAARLRERVAAARAAADAAAASGNGRGGAGAQVPDLTHHVVNATDLLQAVSGALPALRLFEHVDGACCLLDLSSLGGAAEGGSSDETASGAGAASSVPATPLFLGALADARAASRLTLSHALLPGLRALHARLDGSSTAALGRLRTLIDAAGRLTELHAEVACAQLQRALWAAVRVGLSPNELGLLACDPGARASLPVLPPPPPAVAALWAAQGRAPPDMSPSRARFDAVQSSAVAWPRSGIPLELAVREGLPAEGGLALQQAAPGTAGSALPALGLLHEHELQLLAGVSRISIAGAAAAAAAAAAAVPGGAAASPGTHTSAGEIALEAARELLAAFLREEATHADVQAADGKGGSSAAGIGAASSGDAGEAGGDAGGTSSAASSGAGGSASSGGGKVADTAEADREAVTELLQLLRAGRSAAAVALIEATAARSPAFLTAATATGMTAVRAAATGGHTSALAALLRAGFPLSHLEADRGSIFHLIVSARSGEAALDMLALALTALVAAVPDAAARGALLGLRNASGDSAGVLLSRSPLLSTQQAARGLLLLADAGADVAGPPCEWLSRKIHDDGGHPSLAPRPRGCERHHDEDDDYSYCSGVRAPTDWPFERFLCSEQLSDVVLELLDDDDGEKGEGGGEAGGEAGGPGQATASAAGSAATLSAAPLRLPAHRLVLAASSGFFDAMLTGAWSDSGARSAGSSSGSAGGSGSTGGAERPVIRVRGVSEAGLRGALTFAYTGELRLLPGRDGVCAGIEILRAASLLAMRRLLDEVRRALHERLGPATAGAVFDAAAQLGSDARALAMAASWWVIRDAHELKATFGSEQAARARVRELLAWVAEDEGGPHGGDSDSD